MPRRRPRWSRLGLAALAGLTLGAGGAERVLETLRATDELRQTEAQEAARWEEESARLQLLLRAHEEATEAAEAERHRTQEMLQRLRREAPPAPEAVLASLESAADRAASAIETGLDELGQSAPPGLVPSPDRNGDGTAGDRLDRALHRLERTERSAGSIEVLVIQGELEGEARAVELLRFGGVTAWWRSLDGTEGGEAETVDGKVTLHARTEPGILEAIARAAAIAKGRRAPELLLLPAGYARTSAEDDP